MCPAGPAKWPRAGFEQIHLFSSSHWWQREVSSGGLFGTLGHLWLSGFSWWMPQSAYKHARVYTHMRAHLSLSVTVAGRSLTGAEMKR